jgi:prevent-host-death family protein
MVMMKIASVADVKTQFSAYLRASEQGPVVVTRNGKPVAVLVAVGDEDELERLILAHSPKLRSILDAAHRRIQSGEGIPHDEFWEKLETKNRSKQRRTGRRKPA